MNEKIKKRLEALEASLGGKAKVVVIEEGGRYVKVDAAAWWENRHEWRLARWDHQDNGGGLVVCLFLAGLLDDGVKKAAAAGDVAEVERLSQEREDLLEKFWRCP